MTSLDVIPAAVVALGSAAKFRKAFREAPGAAIDAAVITFQRTQSSRLAEEQILHERCHQQHEDDDGQDPQETHAPHHSTHHLLHGRLRSAPWMAWPSYRRFT